MSVRIDTPAGPIEIPGTKAEIQYRGLLAMPQLRDAASRITYEPGWSIGVVVRDDWPFLQVTTRTTDSTGKYNPKLDFQVTHMFFVPPDLYEQEAAFIEWVDERVLAVRRHEHREFFKVDGQVRVDPHDGRGLYR